jgi:hypothetical protein
MRATRIYFGLALVASLLSSCIVIAEEVQVPFIEDSPLFHDPITDVIPEPDLLDEPVPPPIWSLCGNPSTHLLIPYTPSTRKLTK